VRHERVQGQSPVNARTRGQPVLICGDEIVRTRYILVDDKAVREDVVQMFRKRSLAGARCTAAMRANICIRS